jgi:hypothetical protein
MMHDIFQVTYGNLKHKTNRLFVNYMALFQLLKNLLTTSQRLYFGRKSAIKKTALMTQRLILALISMLFVSLGHAQSLQIKKREPVNVDVHRLHATPLDCQLRLEGIEPNLSLIYSNGAVPVSSKALQFDKTSEYVRVFSSGKIFDMSVTSMFVPFHKNRQNRFKGLWAGIDPSSGLPVEGNSLQFQLNLAASAAVRTLSKALNMKFHIEQRLSPGSDEQYVVYVSDSATYPKMEIWSDNKNSYLQYQCVLP